MCRNCSVITQANFSCGHQLHLWREWSSFCLFYPHQNTDFHQATIAYETYARKSKCYECELRKRANEEGLKGPIKYDYVRSRYDKSRELNQKNWAKESFELAKKSQAGPLDEARIEALNDKAKSQVKFYLGQGTKTNTKFGKANLLKTILQVPEGIDRRALITVFGSYAVWDQKQNVWKGLPTEDRGYLLAIARRAGVARLLEEGFAAKTPVQVKDVPVPTKQTTTKPASAN
ncbi:hypothetical protein GGR54DRAFT_288516 [Hypoxylon sp. NC1633]|nr:hypothetical protein GGR54DRAFT_288516 [Hypoxylon sp. NC1633]